MCGICGFTGAAPNDASDMATLRAMCDIMAHRGPDGEGQYIDDGIALGHRRLSLIDLEGGNQPMVRASSAYEAAVTSPALGPDGLPREGQAAAHTWGEWAIVFNGEIYNYRELRDELAEEGWEFQTNSDTEVLLVGYIAWGEDVLLKLRGMFAFAIWNAKTHELFCARDFFGIKPFYYTLVQKDEDGAHGEIQNDVQGKAQDHDRDNDQNGALAGARGETTRPQFIFASEIKSILEHPAYERELNEAALAAYLSFQFNALQETFFKGIFKLPQGHSLRVRADGTLSIKRYWQPTYHMNEERPLDQTVRAIDQAMRESVHYHNVADVEVGSFLSSGIDSSYLAACLAQENPALKTFTVGFAEYDTAQDGQFQGQRDEIAWAAELAERLDVAHETHHITEEEYWAAVPRVQWFMDEPSADPSAVALYFVDQLAARSVKAVLSGEGADEFFGGYRIYQVPLSNRKLDWMPAAALRAGSHALRKLHLRGANYLERASERVDDWYYTNANEVAFTPDEFENLLSPEFYARIKTVDRMENVARIGCDNGDPASQSERECSTRDVKHTINPDADNNQAQAKDASCSAQTTSHFLTPQELTAPVYAEVQDQDETTRMQYVDLWFWLVGDILLKTDKMSMAHSLESRVPFLDREVFELAATIPTAQKVSNEQTKIALRLAAENVIPHDWAQKEKLGFPVPVVNWLREDKYYQLVRDVFTSETAARFFNTEALTGLLDAHRSGTADLSRRIWIIYAFLVWYEQYFSAQ